MKYAVWLRVYWRKLFRNEGRLIVDGQFARAAYREWRAKK